MVKKILTNGIAHAASLRANENGRKLMHFEGNRNAYIEILPDQKSMYIQHRSPNEKYRRKTRKVIGALKLTPIGNRQVLRRARVDVNLKLQDSAKNTRNCEEFKAFSLVKEPNATQNIAHSDECGFVDDFRKLDKINKKMHKGNRGACVEMRSTEEQ